MNDWSLVLQNGTSPSRPAVIKDKIIENEINFGRYQIKMEWDS